jgi:predicted GIY-YIG superfamily endonuclease
MSKHSDGMSKYTSSRRPLRLVYFEIYESRIRDGKSSKVNLFYKKRADNFYPGCFSKIK